MLAFLCFDTRNILATVAERYSGAIDIPDIIDANSSPTGKVTKILEGVYHSDGGTDDDNLDVHGGWTDLSSKDPSYKRRFRSEKVTEARSNSMSATGSSKLQSQLT